MDQGSENWLNLAKSPFFLCKKKQLTSESSWSNGNQHHHVDGLVIPFESLVYWISSVYFCPRGDFIENLGQHGSRSCVGKAK